MGLQGFSNNASGGTSPGDPLFAKTFNHLAASADKAQFGPSPNAIFQSTNGGMALYVNPERNDETDPNLEQFQIIVESYPVGTDTTSFSIIRVVKGEVVWIPKIPEIPGEPPPVVCTTQTTIENWYALPTFPVIDDDDSRYIGDGGIRLPNISGIDVGIFVFKSTMLPIDHPPVIVATPDFTPSCPVVFPGLPPFPGATWQVIKVGRARYDSVVSGQPPQWIVTQNFIGSMVFPGGTSVGPVNDPFLPAQLPSTAIQKARPMPFECRIDVDSGGDMLLKIGEGTISYTKSNMPYVGIGSWVNKFQTQYLQLQAAPSGWKKKGNDADGWMALGGGYKITGDGQWYLVACHWDAVEGTNFTLPDPVKSGKPFLALIDAYGTDVDKLFVETGPGLYTNTMNIQRMSGYTSADTEEPWDWGHCHTTYFNPMKFGYDVKMIARIESRTADQSVAQVFVSQTATAYRNQIQNIYFPVLPKDGFVIFTFDGIPSAPFYPAPWSGVNNATDLFNALQAIPALRGNIAVTRTSEKNFYITFINDLEATDCPVLVANNSGLQSWDYEYIIDQYHVGNLVLDASPKFDGTQIMNKPDVTADEDPYVVQSNADPAFNNIINRADVMACTGLSGDTNFTAGIIPIVDNDSPRGVTTRQWTYGEANGCSGDTCEHPFQVHKNGTDGESATWTVCSGTVNNKEPSNKDDIITLQDGYIWLKCTASNTASFPIAVTLESGTAVPADSDTQAHIVIAHIVAGESTQLLSGSVWGDRIKVGTQTAMYYYAGI